MANQPDTATVWISHALVGVGTAKVLKGVDAVAAFILGVLAHMLFDAPLAKMLAACGL